MFHEEKVRKSIFDINNWIANRFFYYILIINNHKSLINLIVDWKALSKCFNPFIYYKDGCLNLQYL